MIRVKRGSEKYRRLEGKTHLLVCDHIKPHRGDPGKFWDPDNLQTLCKSECHDKHKQARKRAARLYEYGVPLVFITACWRWGLIVGPYR
ncbi:MAG: HNH endonuclease [bacterium]|nr:HNH endonuclease [bacterium]